MTKVDDTSFEEGEEAAQGRWTSAPPSAPPPPSVGRSFTDEGRPAPLILPPAGDWRAAFRTQGGGPAPRSPKFLELVRRIGAPPPGPLQRPLRDSAICQPPRGPGAAPALSLLARVPF
jgi:hypothetical protein